MTSALLPPEGYSTLRYILSVTLVDQSYCQHSQPLHDSIHIYQVYAAHHPSHVKDLEAYSRSQDARPATQLIPFPSQPPVAWATSTGLDLKHRTDQLSLDTDILAGGRPSPFLLRKNSTPCPSPSAPSTDSTQLHHRALFQRLFTNPQAPSFVSLR